MAIDISNYLSTQTGAVGSINPASSTDSLAAGQANLDSSYQTFLTLLTTQLKNQDPTSPLDTNAFTQQLVQMTGVQQQLLSNSLLKTLVTQGQNGSVSDSLSLIGKTVTVTSADAALKDGKASWNYNLDKAAANATLTVTDPSGKVMWSGPAPDLGKGEHTFTWDGKGTVNGTEGGVYTLKVAAADGTGSAVAANISVQGLVTAVRQAETGVVISMSGAEAPVTGVTAVKG
ncbi:MAG TPA: flagellar hook capping FlgD N-terminal domain-containing protein [Caulobacteraceae bacterium]|jgi:flagellar basal-body rod modification protein FlgD|nr:flagellar hook capping FlgD N-terminal domain-containing protein [Caulobacteraceae bacterium]